MLRRIGLNLACNAVEPFLQQRAQRPAGAVARQHVEIVHVEVRFAMRAAHLRRIDVVEPVVRYDLPGNVEDQAAERVALIGVGIDAPVDLFEILVDGAFDIHPAFFGIARLGAGFAINDVCAQRREVARIEKRMLNGVLHLFDVKRNRGLCFAKLRQNALCHDRARSRFVELLRRLSGLHHGIHNLFAVEILHGSVALQKVLRHRRRLLFHRFVQIPRKSKSLLHIVFQSFQ